MNNARNVDLQPSAFASLITGIQASPEPVSNINIATVHVSKAGLGSEQAPATLIKQLQRAGHCMLQSHV